MCNIRVHLEVIKTQISNPTAKQGVEDSILPPLNVDTLFLLG